MKGPDASIAGLAREPASRSLAASQVGWFAGLAAAVLLAAAWVAMSSAPAAAQPSCDGQLATITDNDGTDADPAVGKIEGTNGPDVIVGTDGDDQILGFGGRDRICGGTGNDLLIGGDGNDRIFGGSGDDNISGLGGHDDLFGFSGDDEMFGGDGRDFANGGGGDDFIRGNNGDDILAGRAGADTIRGDANDDRIDGGPADDDCKQGAGSGPVRNCESADLKVVVIAPKVAKVGSAPFKVKITNLGPQATTYSLLMNEDSENSTCDPLWDNTTFHYAALAPGRSRTRVFEPDCQPFDDPEQPAWVEVEAKVSGDARDPRTTNDKAKKRKALRP